MDDAGVRPRALTPDEAFTDWSAALVGPTPNPFDPFDPRTEVYTLPVGVELFHGAPHYVDPAAVLGRANFFGDWRTASVYHLGDDGRSGCIHRFTVIRPIVVLALDSCSNIRAGAFRREPRTPPAPSARGPPGPLDDAGRVRSRGSHGCLPVYRGAPSAAAPQSVVR